MKYQFFGGIAAIATFLTIFGLWAKITHQGYADITLRAGMWTLAVSAGLYVYLMFTHLNKNKDR